MKIKLSILLRKPKKPSDDFPDEATKTTTDSSTVENDGGGVLVIIDEDNREEKNAESRQDSESSREEIAESPRDPSEPTSETISSEPPSIIPSKSTKRVHFKDAKYKNILLTHRRLDQNPAHYYKPFEDLSTADGCTFKYKDILAKFRGDKNKITLPSTIIHPECRKSLPEHCQQSKPCDKRKTNYASSDAKLSSRSVASTTNNRYSIDVITKDGRRNSMNNNINNCNNHRRLLLQAVGCPVVACSCYTDKAVLDDYNPYCLKLNRG